MRPSRGDCAHSVFRLSGPGFGMSAETSSCQVRHSTVQRQRGELWQPERWLLFSEPRCCDAEPVGVRRIRVASPELPYAAREAERRVPASWLSLPQAHVLPLQSRFAMRQRRLVLSKSHASHVGPDLPVSRSHVPIPDRRWPSPDRTSGIRHPACLNSGRTYGIGDPTCSSRDRACGTRHPACLPGTRECWSRNPT